MACPKTLSIFIPYRVLHATHDLLVKDISTVYQEFELLLIDLKKTSLYLLIMRLQDCHSFCEQAAEDQWRRILNAFLFGKMRNHNEVVELMFHSLSKCTAYALFSTYC